MKRKIDIILAIATKDIIDALKNKAILSIFLGVSFLLLANLAMPMLLNIALDPILVIHDEGHSMIIEDLKKTAINKTVVKTKEAFVHALSESLNLTLGVIIPENFDEIIQSTDTLTLRASYMNWESKSNLDKMVFFFEDQLSLALGKDLILQVDENSVFPPLSTRGKAATRAVSLVLIIVVFSMVTVPFLIQDEKERKTLDVILISPATFWQVILGKAIAGMVFGVVAAILMLIFNHAYIQLWGLAVLSTIVGIVFAVSVGLLMGVLFDNAQNMSIMIGFFMAILILPAVLIMTTMDYPAWVITSLSLIPTDKLAQNFLISFGDRWIWPEVLINLGVLAGFSMVLLFLTVLRIRKTTER